MGFLFFAILFIVVLIAAGFTSHETRKNHADMINVTWLSEDDKFRLITRWGIK